MRGCLKKNLIISSKQLSELKLFHSLFNSNSYCNRSTYHRIVTHTDKSHHLNVSWN